MPDPSGESNSNNIKIMLPIAITICVTIVGLVVFFNIPKADHTLVRTDDNNVGNNSELDRALFKYGKVELCDKCYSNMSYLSQCDRLALSKGETETKGSYNQTFSQIVLDVNPKVHSLVVLDHHSLSLECAAKTSPDVVIKWYFDKTSSKVIAQGSKLFVRSVTRRHEGTFTCIASNGVSEEVRHQFTVKVDYGVIIDVVDDHVSAPIGSEAVLTCIVRGYKRSPLSWHFEGTLLIDSPDHVYSQNHSNEQTIFKLILPSLTTSNYGRYLCQSFYKYSQPITLSDVRLTPAGECSKITPLPYRGPMTKYTEMEANHIRCILESIGERQSLMSDGWLMFADASGQPWEKTAQRELKRSRSKAQEVNYGNYRYQIDHITQDLIRIDPRDASENGIKIKLAKDLIGQNTSLEYLYGSSRIYTDITADVIGILFIYKSQSQAVVLRLNEDMDITFALRLTITDCDKLLVINGVIYRIQQFATSFSINQAFDLIELANIPISLHSPGTLSTAMVFNHQLARIEYQSGGSTFTHGVTFDCN